MKRSRLLAALLATIGCATRMPTLGPSSTKGLMQADRDFARVTAERGLDGWMSFYAEDAVRVPQNGRAEGRRRATDGRSTVIARGRYLTIWRKEPSGRWKVILDTGSSEPS